MYNRSYKWYLKKKEKMKKQTRKSLAVCLVLVQACRLFSGKHWIEQVILKVLLQQVAFINAGLKWNNWVLEETWTFCWIYSFPLFFRYSLSYIPFARWVCIITSILTKVSYLCAREGGKESLNSVCEKTCPSSF